MCSFRSLLPVVNRQWQSQLRLRSFRSAIGCFGFAPHSADVSSSSSAVGRLLAHVDAGLICCSFDLLLIQIAAHLNCCSFGLLALIHHIASAFGWCCFHLQCFHSCCFLSTCTKVTDGMSVNGFCRHVPLLCPADTFYHPVPPSRSVVAPTIAIALTVVFTVVFRCHVSSSRYVLILRFCIVFLIAVSCWLDA